MRDTKTAVDRCTAVYQRLIGVDKKYACIKALLCNSYTVCSPFFGCRSKKCNFLTSCSRNSIILNYKFQRKYRTETVCYATCAGRHGGNGKSLPTLLLASTPCVDNPAADAALPTSRLRRWRLPAAALHWTHSNEFANTPRHFLILSKIWRNSAIKTF